MFGATSYSSLVVAEFLLPTLSSSTRSGSDNLAGCLPGAASAFGGVAPGYCCFWRSARGYLYQSSAGNRHGEPVGWGAAISNDSKYARSAALSAL